MTIYLSEKDETAIKFRDACFPGFTGKRFKVSEITGPMDFHDTYWDGGAKSEYVLIDLATFRRVAVPEAHPGFNQQRFLGQQGVTIPSGFAVVQLHRWGKNSDLTIHLRPENIAPLLITSHDITPNEFITLYLTRSLKSAYRQDERKRIGMSRDDWDAAQVTLKERGYLKKNGAITPDGRNAIEAKSNGRIQVHESELRRIFETQTIIIEG